MQKHSDFEQKRSKQIWAALLLSLPLDLIAVALVPEIGGAEGLSVNLELILAVCLAVFCISSAHEKIEQLAFRARGMRARLLASKWGPLAVVAALALIIFVEVLLKSQDITWFAVLFSAVVVAGAVGPLLKLIKERREFEKRKSEDHGIAQVEHAEFLQTLSLVPAVSGRSASLLLAIVLALHSGPYYLAPLFGLLLLLSVKPSDAEFKTYCRRCGCFLPRALLLEDICESCKMVKLKRLIGKTPKS